MLGPSQALAVQSSGDPPAVRCAAPCLQDMQQLARQVWEKLEPLLEPDPLGEAFASFDIW